MNSHYKKGQTAWFFPAQVKYETHSIKPVTAPAQG
jgi:hypothetical protein